MIKPIDVLIAEVKAHDVSATPGPWQPLVVDRQDWWRCEVAAAGPTYTTAGVDHGECAARDADLIAHFRTAAPALAREVVRLRAEVERQTAELEEARRAPAGVLAEVAAERAQQVAKGYTAEHDDGAEMGELAELAGLLLLNDFDLCDIYPDVQIQAQVILDKYDEDRRRQIIIALALGLAEVERQDRLRARELSTPPAAPE